MQHPLVTADHWPYPRWIAHRGAGKLAPENTLAAFRLGAGFGYRMFECDVKLSSDDVPFLLHDDTLDRTSNGHGSAVDQRWDNLAQLDAGSWHSLFYTGEPIPTLDAITRFCRDHQCLLNIEIKPTPGTEWHTGSVVARCASTLWAQAPVPPLLTSFAVQALQGAQAAAPELPRGLLLDKLWNGWLEMAVALGCVAVIGKHTLWSRHTIIQTNNAGLRALSYTVNDTETAQRLLTLGVVGIITDRVDLFSPTE